MKFFKLLLSSIAFINSVNPEIITIAVHGHVPSKAEMISAAICSSWPIQQNHNNIDRIQWPELVRDPDHYGALQHKNVNFVFSWGQEGKTQEEEKKSTELSGSYRPHQAISAIKLYNQLNVIKTKSPQAEIHLYAHSNGGNMCILMSEISRYLKNKNAPIDSAVKEALDLAQLQPDQSLFFYIPKTILEVDFFVTLGTPVIPENNLLVNSQSFPETFIRSLFLYSNNDFMQNFDRVSSGRIVNKLFGSGRRFKLKKRKETLQANIALSLDNKKHIPGHAELAYGPNLIEQDLDQARDLLFNLYQPMGINCIIEYLPRLKDILFSENSEFQSNELEITIQKNLPLIQELQQSQKSLDKLKNLVISGTDQAKSIIYFIQMLRKMH